MRDRKKVFGPTQDLSREIKTILPDWLNDLTDTQLLVLAVCGDNENWRDSDVFVIDPESADRFMAQLTEVGGSPRRFMLMVVADHDLAYGMFEYFDDHHPYEIVMELAVRVFVTS